VKVDRYVASSKDDEEKSHRSNPAATPTRASTLATIIEMAMTVYESASSSWNTWITGGEAYQATVGPIEKELQQSWKTAASVVASAEKVAKDQ
jgi:hypothetical protein